MKKIFGVLIIIGLVLSGCATKEVAAGRGVPDTFPAIIRDALKKAPPDALVGIGTAKLASLAQSRVVAQTRARAEISRQMTTIIEDMVRDYQASSEVDPSSAISFQENITVALSKAELRGAAVMEEYGDPNGNYWVVVVMNKTDVVNEINQAQAAAKLQVPAMASFNAEDRMNEAFARVQSQPYVVNDRN